MGRPKGSKNKPKTAPANAAPGHNSDPGADERRALFFHHFGKVKAAEAVLKEAKAAVDKLLKTAEEDGIPKKDLKWALKQEGANQEKALAQARRQMEIARWLQLPIGTQVSLFDEDRTPAADKAFEEGKNAGLQGKTCISPYSPETEQSRKWIEGWHDGQRVLRETFLKRHQDSGAGLIPPEEPPPAESSDLDAALADAMTDAPADVPAEEAPPAADGTWPDGAAESEDVRPRFLQGEEQAEEEVL